ncbi:hypothetical protein LPJ57_001706 [Coemansia sp. RSA 486]|nr:hypothetical protein LPJ57_001706 [Coemansia sp. RSA 486]
MSLKKDRPPHESPTVPLLAHESGDERLEDTPIVLRNSSRKPSSAAHASRGLNPRRVAGIGAAAIGILIFVGGLYVLGQNHKGPAERSTLIKAKHGAVATDEPHCSTIGVDVLREGGNAVDAAVASTLCIGLLQAHSSGIGGGGFMLVRPSNASEPPVLFDFRETAGGAAAEDMFESNITLARIGGLSIGVPGEVAGLYKAHSRFGKLPWSRLLEPTIKLAREGYALSQLVHDQLKTMETYVLTSAGFNTTYTDGHGNILNPGDIVRRPELADTLQEIATHGASAFYNGRIADSLVRTVQENGGILTKQDFASYKAVERKPLEIFYHGQRVITGSPPTSGSILLNMLNVVEGYPLALEGQSALNYHRIVETMKFGAALRTTLGDPSFVDISANITKHISKQFASEIRANISDTRTFGYEHYSPDYDILNNHGTTHLSVLDSSDMAVAVTSTINLEFGSRIMDPRTGIILNDEMDDFSTSKKPNGFGLRPSPNNKIIPGKRPLSSTSATIVEKDGQVRLVIGGSGGSRILTAVLQVLVNVLDFDMRLDHAIDMPRFHHQLLPSQLSVDPLFPSCLTNALAGFGHEIVPMKHANSIVQAVQKSMSDGTIYATKYIALVAAVGQATATLDMLTGRPLSEAIFGLTPDQVKKVDSTVARVEQEAQSAAIGAYTNAAKTVGKIVADINKNAGPAVNDAAAALNKALTPDVKQKLKKAISTIVDSTLNALL